MIKKVKNKASPTNTVFGGVCAVPKAWRKIDNTIMMRTNEVIISNIDGNSVSVVIKPSNCRLMLYCWPPLPPLTFTKGIPCACAIIGNTHMAMNNNAIKTKVSLKETGLRNMRCLLGPSVQGFDFAGADTCQHHLVVDLDQHHLVFQT